MMSRLMFRANVSARFGSARIFQENGMQFEDTEIPEVKIVTRRGMPALPERGYVAVSTPGKLSVTTAPDTMLDVTVVIGITGRLTGIAVYGMSEEMAMSVVSRMMGSPIDELDDLAISGIAEMANVITGHATTLLTAMGLHCDISTPTVLLGSGARLSTGKIQRLVMPLHTDLGILQTQVAVKVTSAKS